MEISISELKIRVIQIFQNIGFSEHHSEIISDVLVSAEKRGIPSHGINRIKDYLWLWSNGKLNPSAVIKIIYETPVTTVIDGDNGCGIVVSEYAMQKTIEKAESNYMAFSAVRNSNHYGIAGYYSRMAAEKDMLGISMTNAQPVVAPTFGVERMLGTNPLSVAIPAGKEPCFLADFATVPIARGKVELLEMQNKKVPDLFIQDKNGNVSNDPSALREGGAILPLGGDKEHGSHKGFCLSAIIDIFSAVLSGAEFGPFVSQQTKDVQTKSGSPGKGIGHFFGAIRINAFQPVDVFKSNMDIWISTFRNGNTKEGYSNIVIPGEPERHNEALAEINGIKLDDRIIEQLNNTIKELSLPQVF